MAKHASRNPELAQGIPRFGRSRMYSLKKRFLIKKKQLGPVKKEEQKQQPTQRREPRWYSVDSKKKLLPSRKANHKPTRLRASITPGTVLIVLAGNHKGKRVVFLKQLPSGLLLVSGPFKVNGVPLRRINQAYVIATSLKVDVSGVNVSTVKDSMFKAEAAPKTEKKDGDKFFKTGEKKHVVTEARKELQKKVDGALLASISKVPQLKKYLAARFSLTKGQYPHQMKF